MNDNSLYQFATNQVLQANPGQSVQVNNIVQEGKNYRVITTVGGVSATYIIRYTPTGDILVPYYSSSPYYPPPYGYPYYFDPYPYYDRYNRNPWSHPIGRPIGQPNYNPNIGNPGLPNPGLPNPGLPNPGLPNPGAHTPTLTGGTNGRR